VDDVEAADLAQGVGVGLAALSEWPGGSILAAVI
jgi:hypothetical protein